MSSMTLRLATVTQVSPLRVVMDGEATAPDATPSRVASYAPVLHDQVWCLLADRRLLILGKAA